MADVARSAGVSQPTVKTWVNLLEAAYIVRLLPPYFENFGKRVVKSPKLYFLDSALICALTRQPGAEAAHRRRDGRQPLRGADRQRGLHKVFALRGKRPDLYFWRSHDGLEVDLVVRLPRGLVPVEIKLTATPTLKHAEVLRKFRDLAGASAAPWGAGLQRQRAGGAAGRQRGLALAGVSGLAGAGVGGVTGPQSSPSLSSRLRICPSGTGPPSWSGPGLSGTFFCRFSASAGRPACSAKSKSLVSEGAIATP